jgi:hypothetical protein
MAFLGDYASAFSQVLLIGDQFKDVAAKNAGIEVDIWIDDDGTSMDAAASTLTSCPSAS